LPVTPVTLPSIGSSLSTDAMLSIELTRELISKKTLEYISNLPANLIMDYMVFAHGAPPDLVNTYIYALSDEHLMQIFDFKVLRPGVKQIDPKMKHIINVGSVGQPRDGNSDAKYVIFDDAKFTVDLRFVEYDIDKTVKLIEERNFPKYNAERLYQNWVEILG
jgi:diadenosine tetraphosphatase ApaH/serine/threonine PP2A family protein phosphatase